MKRKILRTFAVVFLFCCFLPTQFFAKSKKKQAKTSDEEITTKQNNPAWLTDEGRLSLFSSEEYISNCAFGSTSDEAKSKAAANISEFVKSSVQSSASSRYSEFEKNGIATEQSSTETIAQVTSDNRLYQLEYTTPFFMENAKEFACVAYINREKAFNAVKPKLDKGTNLFPQEYEKALQIEDSFLKIITIRNAQKIMNDFYEVYDFSVAISPKKAEIYKSTDELYILSAQKLNELKNDVKIFVQVQNDNANKVKNTLMEILEEEGFSVTKNASLSNYFLQATVSAEIQKSSDVFLSYPGISLEIKNFDTEENVYSYSDTYGKSAGFDKESATRSSYNKICKNLKENLFK